MKPVIRPVIRPGDVLNVNGVKYVVVRYGWWSRFWRWITRKRETTEITLT